MRTVFISAAWTVATLLAIVAWRRLVPAPMPRIFDFILRTKFRRRTFSPEAAAERHGLAPGMRVLEVGPAGGYLTAAAAQKLKPHGTELGLAEDRLPPAPSAAQFASGRAIVPGMAWQLNNEGLSSKRRSLLF